MKNQEIKLVPQSGPYKLIVKESLERKIRFLCDRLPHNEYSGTLFYKTTGSFETNDLVIIAEDLYLQDVGSGGYTEFQRDVTLASYIVENELFTYYHGLIHSHNVMETIFTKGRLGSSTDMDTLVDEGKDQNHFVSLIVNNAGNYAAAITRRIDRTVVGKQKTSYSTFNNGTVDFGKTSDITMKDFYIEYFMLDIEIEHPVIVKDPLEERLKELRNSTNSFVNRGYEIARSQFFNESSKSNTKQLELFEGKETNKQKVNNYEDYEEDDEPNNNFDKRFVENSNEETPEINKVLFTDNLFKSHIAQIITGNIFAHYNKNLDINKWSVNMNNIYDKRFEEFEDFESFAEALADLLYSEVCEKLESTNFDVDFNVEYWVQTLVSKLEEFEKNEYLSSYIDILNRYRI